MEKTKGIKWEKFLDESYFYMWAVRPEGDKDFTSPHLKHFKTEQEAIDYINKQS